MKKSLLLSVMAVSVLGIMGTAQAETVQGKVLTQKGDVVTMQQADGKIVTVKTTDNTTYRKKKLLKKDKKKNGKMMKRGDSYYTPMMDEDEWIEVTYNPDTNTSDWIAEDVVVYDD